MNDFDKAARRAVKDAGADHIAWVFPKLAGRLVFERWLDSQSAPRPNEPDRRCDTIARLKPPGGLGPLWTAVLELFTNPDPDSL
ncbi:MAG: hypothetical protein K2W96_09585, partial [Gemmataceae bacterium]|nr:hypothetical protein [Gemmataceae bacterium]